MRTLQTSTEAPAYEELGDEIRAIEDTKESELKVGDQGRTAEVSEGSEPDSLGEFEQFFDKPGQERVEDLVFSVSKRAA